MGDSLPITERVARPLTSLAPEEQPIVWQAAVESAPNGKVTAAQLGLEAQNHAAEVKLRAERRAGELLSQLERNPGIRTELPRNTMLQGSEYATTLTDTGLDRMTAHRWQVASTIPEPVFEEHIAEVKAEGKELTSASVLRVASSLADFWRVGNSELEIAS